MSPKASNVTTGEALRRSWWSFVAVGVASALINILYLTGSFFMLQVYDRVLPSKSIPTLVSLCLLALILYLFQGWFEVIRSRMLVRIAASLDEVLNGRVFQAMLQMPFKARMPGDGMQPLRDFDHIRNFLSGMGPPAFFDLPWMPFYVAICFLFHPLVGWLAIFGAVVLACLTFMTNWSSRKHSKLANEYSNARNGYALLSLRNAEVIRAMGMSGRITKAWQEKNSAHRALMCTTSDVGNGYAAISKIFRLALQSAVLAVGALLVMDGSASAGIMIAASILTSRALAPVELAIGNWKGFIGARDAWRRTSEVLAATAEQSPPLQLPAPRNVLAVEKLAGSAPASKNLIFVDIDFKVHAGSAVGIVGMSASGKSALARVLLQLWPTVRGSVRLDGAELSQWSAEDLGRYIGYLPQDVELFNGTIAENIARFAEDADPKAIIAAAKAARIHEMVIRLANGYDTEIGDAGTLLSAGQRQRVALARALYGDPFLVILDEPNSNLDADGEQALSEAILGVRARGGIVLVIAHRPSVLSSVDLVMVMNGGRMNAFGSRDEVLGRVVSKPERQLQVVIDTKTGN
ncbi:type I secretion system permease/ATPase [Agrobacterium sp. AGB01]|nr:type I secretion system permease/ATPase [Agrobacterium sp. AGB01]